MKNSMTISSVKDLEKEILREHSKRQAVAIARWVGHDKIRFRNLMTLFLHGDYLVTQRAAWIVSECTLHRPELVTPWLGRLLKRMQEPGVHVAVPRNVLRVFESIRIPRALQGKVVTQCFDYLFDPSSPIAIQSYSMTILLNVAQEEPDLKNELCTAIERLLPTGSPGVNARARSVFKKLERKVRPTV
jgi:hypothetical protein